MAKSKDEANVVDCLPYSELSIFYIYTLEKSHGILK